MSETIFECRCCSKYCKGTTDGHMEPGWKRIGFIDGPNAICPACVDDPASLDSLLADGYAGADVYTPAETR